MKYVKNRKYHKNNDILFLDKLEKYINNLSDIIDTFFYNFNDKIELHKSTIEDLKYKYIHSDIKNISSIYINIDFKEYNLRSSDKTLYNLLNRYSKLIDFINEIKFFNKEFENIKEVNLEYFDLMEIDCNVKLKIEIKLNY